MSQCLEMKMVRDAGFEPATPTVSVWCSTTELTAHFDADEYLRQESGIWQVFKKEFCIVFLREHRHDTEHDK